ncbi:DUF3833 family protein [Halodesulfovibrio marinisediminis]|uniref:DUF3833 domain-containing protein n=1 Tax=Halodesulfovibrio marinisediminis DSM 17456 TaxID=1121457 RepID=A0A1N6DVI3_9BACT|nr:DUF3833 family protein [Halodesulfovibrio marinisediminis]SIN74771.1 Protein of unknown function [Halodesulfovibrio marinisediminis DSM 17456]
MNKIIWPLCAMMLVGCSNITPSENAAGGHPIVLEKFFTGELKAHGVILGFGGKVKRSFNAVMHGEWREEEGVLKGVLTEKFIFDDGEKLERRWDFTSVGDGRFEGTASDVEGTAKLETSGNALRMDYALLVPVSGRTISVQVEDWLWLMTPDILVNKSTMRKWGFKVGEIITTIVR